VKKQLVLCLRRRGYQRAMVENITFLLPYLVLISHVVFVVLLLAIIFRNSWGRDVQIFLGRYALLLAFLISISAVIGSLFYSEIIGFEPCVLCWWQRVFLYPLVIIFGMAIWKKAPRAFLYAVPLTLLGALVASYHSYVSLGGASLLPCTAVGEACSKVYVMAFGYVTLPFMGLTVALYILLLAWADKIYKNENRNA